MGSLSSRMVLCVGVVAVTSSFPAPGIGNAQPGPRSPAPADARKRATAKQLVDEGIAAQKAGDYDRAVDLYMRAFSLVSHPILLFNIAQSHRLAGRPDRAVPFYERYLALDPDGPESATARTYLAEAKDAPSPAAKASMGQLLLSSKPEGLTVMLDGTKIGVTPLAQDLAAGSHEIVLMDGERRVGERTVQIKAGSTAEVAMLVVSSPPDDRRSSPSRTVPLVLLGTGAVALGAGCFGLYLGQKGGPGDHEDRYRYRGATPAGVAGVVLGAAAVGAGVWWWRRGSRESRPVALVSPDGGYLGWSGRF